jgi:hypothetical protein
MKRIRSRAISEISAFRPRIDPVDQVVLSVKHAIPEWLPLAYAALCQREEAIEVEEAKKMGLETTVMLAKAREAVRKTSTTGQTSDPCMPMGQVSYNPFGIGRASDHVQIQSRPDLPPFDEALVSRVVDEIFWPAQESPKPVTSGDTLKTEVR